MRTTSGWAATLLVVALAGCADEPKGRVGDFCGGDEDCAAGLCEDGVCLDPNGDEDLDGLTNGYERTIGTDPLASDTDGDGKPDPDEVGGAGTPADVDGDGLIDAVESALPTSDGDGDCLPDEVDADNASPTTENAALVAYWCSATGVCGANAGAITAACDPKRADEADRVRCEYGAVPGYEADEAACDALDNDCDGATDEPAECGALPVAPPRPTRFVATGGSGASAHFRLDFQIAPPLSAVSAGSATFRLSPILPTGSANATGEMR